MIEVHLLTQNPDEVFWQQHNDFDWMGDTLGDKFNFYYLVDDMVSNGRYY